MRTTFLRTSLPLAAALALVTGVAAASSPLGLWMKTNMGTALAAEDYGALKTNFDLLATKQPSADYGDWARFAKTGSGAAAKKDGTAAHAACNACHDAYKQKYRKDFPSKPFP
jgi:hypothetical protein